MFKRIKFSFFTWTILLFISLSGIILMLNSVHLAKAQDDAEKYRISKECDDANSCREIMAAIIESSQTVRLTNTIWIHRGYSKNYTNVAYYVRLRLKNLEVYDLTILPNLDVEDEFNLPNIYFPSTSNTYDRFVESTIPENAILNVELWNGEPTIIFTKYIDMDFVSIDNFPIFSPVEITQDDAETEEWIEYAIPTVNNPLVKLQLLQEKLDQTLTYISVFGFILIVLRIVVKLK